MTLKIQLLNEKCKLSRANVGDAGLDCRSSVDSNIRPEGTDLIPLGFKVEIPFGYTGFLVSRSGQGKVRVSLANAIGIIDHQYRGEVMARIENRGTEPYLIHEGDRVAQLIIVPIALLEPEYINEVSTTDRGEGGFGSTGTK